MASSVFYKFKSQKAESRVTFDGTGIAVFDLKKEIILANNLGKANDFDIVVLDGSSGEELKDDSQIIPRSSSVVVKRVPPTRPGKGKAAMYLSGPGATAASESKSTSAAGSSWSGKGSVSRRFDKEAPSKPAIQAPLPSLGGKDDEIAAMAAMFQAQSANWEETQEKMSHQTRIYTNPRGTSFGRGGKPFAPHHQQAEKPLPPSYVCYRCGQKGHWIQDCPTNNDRDFDNKPRIKRTTGIPRSFLKAVDNPGGARIGQGVMVTPEGGYVVAQPDSASWQRQTSKSKSLSEAEVRERPSKDPTIICSIDNKILRDAVKTPCCGTAYCEDCIQTYLLEKDFICPSCASKVASLDKLAIDKPTRMKVTDYIAREIEASQKEEDSHTSESTPVGSVSQTPALDDLQSGLYAQEDVPADLAMSQMIVDNIPQLQAQIQQISLMLQNSGALPAHVRQQTEMQRQQLQMQLAQAQTIAAALAAAQSASAIGPADLMMPMGMLPMMNQGYNVPQMQIPQQQPQQQAQQQPGNADSAYQRQPVNNRRRNIKRERPSDFLEVAGPDAEKDNKVARYWE